MKRSTVNELAGTPYYVAPEVIDENYGKKADVWSMGVVLYFLMSGKLPFVATNMRDLFDKIKQKHFQMPKEFSEDLRDLVKKMLMKDPDQRISALEAMNHPWFKNCQNKTEV